MSGDLYINPNQISVWWTKSLVMLLSTVSSGAHEPRAREASQHLQSSTPERAAAVKR